MNKNKYKAQEKWQKKVGLISKSYKLPKEITTKFVETCKKNNVSQASIIKQAMIEYIKKFES